MNYSLSNNLSSNVSGIDPDARLYIAAVEAVLPGNNIATALPNAVNPKRIISDFIKAEKTASRWSLHKRIYLPIYNNVAASAVDMVSRTNGTFIGTVTHAAGYVQGDGTSGYFNTNNTPSFLNLTLSSGLLFALIKTVDSRTDTRSFLGATDDAAGSVGVNFGKRVGSLLNLDYGGISARVTGSLADNLQNGILTATRHGGISSIRKRSFSGVSSIVATTIANSGQIPSVRPFFFMGNNYVGSLLSPTNAQMGAFGIGLGLNTLDTDAFTTNLKTLWESLTGLTLP